jgi:hypothetical protein
LATTVGFGQRGKYLVAWYCGGAPNLATLADGTDFIKDPTYDAAAVPKKENGCLQNYVNNRGDVNVAGDSLLKKACYTADLPSTGIEVAGSIAFVEGFVTGGTANTGKTKA